MEFRQIEAFVNAARYKSFSKAADASFLTQPTISAHINNLENELDTLLLNRLGREITLTGQGELFYHYAIEMLNTRSQALLSVQKLSDNIEGVLDIHTSSIPGQYYLPKLMSLFHKSHSNVRFFVEQSDSREVINNIIGQNGEIGLTGYKINNGLVYEPLFMDEMVLLTPNSQAFAERKNGSKLSFETFAKEAFILREDGSGTKQEMEKAEVNGMYPFKDVHVVARMNSMEAIKQAVADGLGVSLLSRRAIEDSLCSHGVKYFRIEGLKKKRTFYLVYNKNIYLSPVATAFRSMVMEYRDANMGSDLK